MPRPYQIERRTAVASGQPVSAHPEIEHLVMDRPDRGLCASQTVAMSTLFTASRITVYALSNSSDDAGRRI